MGDDGLTEMNIEIQGPHSCECERPDPIHGSLDEVRELAHEWMECYNYERPHDALNGIPPALYREQLEQQTQTETKSPRTLKSLI